MMPSDPRYPELAYHAEAIAALSNPCMIVGRRGMSIEVAEWIIAPWLAELKAEMQILLDAVKAEEN